MQDLTQKFINEAMSQPMLGEDHSPNALIKSYMRLVIAHTTQYRTHPLYEDILQSANLALVKAAHAYDASRGIAFASYAIPNIKYAILTTINDDVNPVKLLTTKPIRKAFFNVKKYRTGDVLTSEQISKMVSDLGISADDIREMERRMSSEYIFIDSGSEDDVPFDVQAEHADPIDLLERMEYEDFLTSDLTAAIAALNEREQFIINSRWVADEKLTLHDLAAIFGISPERIRQLEANALKKLRKALDNSYNSCKIETY